MTATQWSLSSPHCPAPSCLSVLCQLSSVLNLYPACCAGCIFPKCSSRNQCRSSFSPIVEILCARCPVSFLISCSKQSNLNRNSDILSSIFTHSRTHTHTCMCVKEREREEDLMERTSYRRYTFAKISRRKKSNTLNRETFRG